MKKLQIIDSMLAIVEMDGERTLSVSGHFPIGVNSEVGNVERYSASLGGFNPTSLSISPFGIKNIAGIVVNATGIVKITSGDDIKAQGDNILMNGVSMPSFVIEAMNRVLDEGELDSVGVALLPDRTSLICEEKNYTHSIATGTPVEGPFEHMEGKTLYVQVGNKELISIYVSGIKTKDESGNTLDVPEDEATGTLVALAIERLYNGYCGESIEVSYDNVTHRFSVRSILPGPVHIDFPGGDLDSRLAIGMASPEFKKGGDDYAGKKVLFLSGPAEGEKFEISEINHNEIILSDVVVPAPEAGDRFQIIDDSVAIKADIMVFDSKVD